MNEMIMSSHSFTTLCTAPDNSSSHTVLYEENKESTTLKQQIPEPKLTGKIKRAVYLSVSSG